MEFRTDLPSALPLRCFAGEGQRWGDPRSDPVTNYRMSTYRCPIDERLITDAVHRSRRRRGHPTCRKCLLVKRLDGDVCAVRSPRVVEDSLVFSCRNTLSIKDIRSFGGHFSTHLLRTRDSGVGKRDGLPRLAVAHDGHPATWGPLVALVDAIRTYGTHVSEFGVASGPEWAHRLQRMDVDAGLYFGVPTGSLGGFRIVGDLRDHQGRHLPIDGALLGRLWQKTLEGAPSRPTRTSAATSSSKTPSSYRQTLSALFHGLRPLRVTIGVDDQSTTEHLRALTPETALLLDIIPANERLLTKRIADAQADLGVLIGENGMRCDMFDETSRPITPADLLAALGRHLLETLPKPVEQATASSPLLIADVQTARDMARRDDSRVCATSVCDGTPHDVVQTMHEKPSALLGYDGHRIWHRVGRDLILPDGLRTLALVLGLLSRSDRPASCVLDETAPTD